MNFGRSGALIKKILETITPTAPRLLGGHYIEYIPEAAAGPIALATVANAAWLYGNQTVIANAALLGTADAWVEGIVVSDVTSAGTYIVGLTLNATGTGAPPAAGILEAIIPVYLGIRAAITGAIQSKYMPIRPPIYIPAGGQIGGALAHVSTGVVSCHVRLVLSRNR